MARRLLAPAVAARACQPQPQRCASPPVARGWEHCPPRCCAGTGSRVSGQTDGSKPRVLIEKEIYSLLWLAGPCPGQGYIQLYCCPVSGVAVNMRQQGRDPPPEGCCGRDGGTGTPAGGSPSPAGAGDSCGQGLVRTHHRPTG